MPSKWTSGAGDRPEMEREEFASVNRMIDRLIEEEVGSFT
jgi:hypothetical protein